ncbi:RNA-directed DNA polymerase [Gracilibacillus halophilus YIM-C55.5]|uniref:RNA-directed DNA polymerase n=1 Tax=Gracilibacillus halophilus YIM-C55.5 TaxID=1308866 RepID=N4WUC2_9BACI|nr:group II intron reverse transcriptase/maturase [Gracilibacillus halophilus]ENH97950.1 RNA-directed DNA polymerase [Gracilibacillus halophilus YIM-C55.5]
MTYNMDKRSRSTHSKRLVRTIVQKYGYGEFDRFVSRHRPHLIHYAEASIITIFNHELTDIMSNYQHMLNKSYLQKIFYLAQRSLIKTIAHKRRISAKKVTKRIKGNPERKIIVTQLDQNGIEKEYALLTIRDFY